MNTKSPVILVVDDDSLQRRTISLWLAQQGYPVVESFNGRHALEVLDKQDIDLVLLDLRMPVLDGFGVLTELAGREDAPPVVVISGHNDFAGAVRAFRLGAKDYVTKPIESYELLELIIGRVLESVELTRKVRRAERRYANLVHGTPVLIFVTKPDGTLVFANRYLETMLGTPPVEVLGEPGWLLDRFHPSDRDKVADIFSAAAEGEESVVGKSLECRLVRADGALVHGLLRCLPDSGGATDAPGQVEGLIVDITDRVALERSVVQREKLKTLGTIAAEVAHEIRNPLMSIGGFARILKEKHPEITETDIILGESMRLERLLDRIREYLAPLSPKRTPCDVVETVTGCLDWLRPELERKSISASLDVVEGLPRLELDRELLVQALVNLARLAVGTMPERSSLHVSVSDSESFVHIRFNLPSSAPLPEEERLYAPFDGGQGQAAEDPGLPYCLRVVKSMGGNLSVEHETNRASILVSLPKKAQSGTCSCPA